MRYFLGALIGLPSRHNAMEKLPIITSERGATTRGGSVT